MTHSVNDLASSFVEMAKAYERLPEVERELTTAKSAIDDHLDTIQRLELKLIDKENVISDLQTRIQTLEVARDDAELRFLECDDAKSTLVRTLEVIRSDIDSVLQAVTPLPQEPPKAEPLPLIDGSLSSPFVTAATSPPDASSSDAVSGQSEPDPTSQSACVDTGTENTTSSSDAGQSEAPFAVITTPDTPTPGEKTASVSSNATPEAIVSSNEPSKFIPDDTGYYWPVTRS